jgi:hypothetical protein|tara:strand:+ start:7034 stop:7336 length:303 start_codon:yes stop_codon:yes gene_type:complete
MTFTNIKDIDAFLAANADRACTFEDMGNSLYSDIYKDAYGFRPRHTEVPFATVGDLYKEIESLYAYQEEEARHEAKREQEEKDAHNLELIAAERDWLTIS